MPPKRTGDTSAKRKQATGAQSKTAGTLEVELDNPFESSDEEVEATSARQKKPARASRGGDVQVVGDGGKRVAEGGGEEEEDPEKTIPNGLLTRLLHEFFTKDATRISSDANATVGKYFDVFVREAIARTAVEKQGGFLEVEDLEKVTPQLLLDL